jgi:vacuolar-type H+-ATPase subunit I/STV1
MKNIKHQKVIELQKTINLYSRECQRLKGIVTGVVEIARKAGLEDKI